jgi:hypothetical protein
MKKEKTEKEKEGDAAREGGWGRSAGGRSEEEGLKKKIK